MAHDLLFANITHRHMKHIDFLLCHADAYISSGKIVLFSLAFYRRYSVCRGDPYGVAYYTPDPIALRRLGLRTP